MSRRLPRGVYKEDPMHRLCIACLFVLLCAAVLAPEAPAARRVRADISAVYSGNPKSMKYHNASCRYFSCKACTVRFASAEEAVRKGYVACKKCGG